MDQLTEQTKQFKSLESDFWRLSMSLQAQYNTLVLARLNDATERTELDNLITFIAVEVPQRLIVNDWFKLIHTKYRGLCK